jgi:uncharacterized membrane protein
MKRFDLANEVSKQLITIASAIIAIVVAFYDKFFSHGTATFIAVLIILVMGLQGIEWVILGIIAAEACR